MESIDVTLGRRALLINSLLMAVLTPALMVIGEWWLTGTVSWEVLLIGAGTFVIFQVFVLFQGRNGRVTLENGRLSVQAGFYNASWRTEGLQIVSPELAGLATGIRINGVAMYGLRAGWYRSHGKGFFVLAKTDERLCLVRGSEVLVCLDRVVVERLRPVLMG